MHDVVSAAIWIPLHTDGPVLAAIDAAWTSGLVALPYAQRSLTRAREASSDSGAARVAGAAGVLPRRKH